MANLAILFRCSRGQEARDWFSVFFSLINADSCAIRARSSLERTTKKIKWPMIEQEHLEIEFGFIIIIISCIGWSTNIYD